MSKPLIMVSSFTSAMRGREALKKHGIKSEVLRSFSKEDGGGCGYSIHVDSDEDRAEKILKEEGINILGGNNFRGENNDIS